MNYGTLKTNVANYLHRDDQAANIPGFILLGQARMSHDLEIPMMDGTESLAVTASVKEVALPETVLRIKSIRIPFSGGFRTLQLNSLVQNSQIYEGAGGATADPLYYARYGFTLELAPPPSADNTLSLIVKKRLVEFVEDTDTDDILTNYPNIYLYAAMLEASVFVEDSERITTWKAYYDDEVFKLNEDAEDQLWSGAPMQIKPSMGVDTP
jgi:hypothetical protein